MPPLPFAIADIGQAAPSRPVQGASQGLTRGTPDA